MVITKALVRDKLVAYLNQQMTLTELVNWAEEAVVEAELEEQYFEILRDILARLGLADVHQFGLSWADWADFLNQLGYEARVEVVPIT